MGWKFRHPDTKLASDPIIMKKILVTGATGFVGNYVVMELLKNNYQVIASSSSESKARSKPWFNQVQYISFNLQDYSHSINYYYHFDQPESMIHLAWEGLPNYNALFHFEENLPRHYAFLKNMVQGGLKDLSVTGTCLEYGFREGVLHEQVDTNPVNSYAIAKDSLRRFLQQLQRLETFSFKWIRLFYMYGKGQNPNSLFSQLDKAIEQGDKYFNMSAGEQIRDYLPVEEVASHIVSIASQQSETGIFNCCSGRPVLLKELVKSYIEARNADICLNLGFYPYLDYEPMSFWGDNTKLKTILQNERFDRGV